jgi:DNA-3-methyladenine glycosylase
VTPIPREFFARTSVEVAPDLLGCVLEHETAEGLVAVELTEVEAYAGRADPASHAYRGKTARNAVMFGPPGHAYVYFTYGMYFCVNLVCQGDDDTASAVLLRAGRVIEGEELARARRARRRARGDRNSASQDSASQDSASQDNASQDSASQDNASASASQDSASRVSAGLAARDLARGPGLLCLALDIDRSLDGADVCVAGSPLRVRRRQTGAGTNVRSGEKEICSGPRVGVSAAADVPWRFWFEGDPTVSAYKPWVARRRKLVTP